MPAPRYNTQYYDGQAPGSIRSAREVLSIVREGLHPRSVVDVGCGVGTWLRAWQELGVEDILGIDGAYVRPEQLLIPAGCFSGMDLKAPTALTRRFDLVQSLEVAEHIPGVNAEAFVSFLCSLGEVVLFSAAIPWQGGTTHVNEQWPEYWANLFLKKGYTVVDTIRDRVWDNPHVEIWYRQNTMLYVNAANRDALDMLTSTRGVPALSRVHPGLWRSRNEGHLLLKWVAKRFPGSNLGVAARKFRRLKKSA